MKFARILSALVSLCAVPSALSQFGVAMKSKGGVDTAFEQLNEKMKDLQGGGGGAAATDDPMDQMRKLMQGAMDNPDMMKAMNTMNDAMADVMQKMGDMDPAALQSQMEEVMKLMTDGSVMDSVMDKKDEVLATLEQTGMVPPEELAKYKADPKYFEESMRGAFDQMKGVFEDPNTLKQASEAMTGMAAGLSDPTLEKMQTLLTAPTEPTNLEIEELRLTLLQKGDGVEKNPAFAMFAGTGLFEDMKDPVAFKAAVVEGRQALKEMLGGAGGAAAAMMGGGAGVGEL